MNKCLECRKKISRGANRCYSCDRQRRNKSGIFDVRGLKNPHYIDGRYLKSHYCKDCNKIIHYDTWKYGKKRCLSCAMKNRYKNHIHSSWKSRKLNMDFKLKEYLRSRIYHVLKGLNKSKPTMKLIGCSIEFLKKYVASKFKRGMSWNNYGFYGWHIDHIRPCASFDLSKPEEQKKCFNYKNLQPLWAKDNILKSDKLEKI